MIIKKLLNIIMVIGLVSTFSISVESQGLGRALMRGIKKGAVEKTRQSMGKILKRDLQRDQSTKVKGLPKDRTVFRYTSAAKAQEEIRQGVRAGSHMTSRATAGRPLSPSEAKRRYGLQQEPDVRLTIRLSKGTRVRNNRALGGKPGVGEITTKRKLPPTAIKRVVPLKE